MIPLGFEFLLLKDELMMHEVIWNAEKNNETYKYSFIDICFSISDHSEKKIVLKCHRMRLIFNHLYSVVTKFITPKY